MTVSYGKLVEFGLGESARVVTREGPERSQEEQGEHRGPGGNVVFESDSDVIRERFKSDSHRKQRFGYFAHLFRMIFDNARAIRMVEPTPYIILEGGKCP